MNKSIPLQQLVEAKCSFTVIHTFVNSGLMKAIENEPNHKNNIENLKNYHNELLKKEVARTAEEGGGLNPLWRARIAIVGSDRSGKTSTVRSIKGEKFDPVSDSTNGLEKIEANVAGIRELGVAIFPIHTIRYWVKLLSFNQSHSTSFSMAILALQRGYNPPPSSAALATSSFTKFIVIFFKVFYIIIMMWFFLNSFH
jgi:hypothetical protein